MSKHAEGMAQEMHGVPLHQKADVSHLGAQWLILDPTLINQLLLPTKSAKHIKAGQRKEEDTENFESWGPQKHHELHDPLNSRKEVAYVCASQNPAGEI